MKKFNLKLKSKMLLFWLSIIAFVTGCGSNGGKKKGGGLINDEPATEYGCPSADYIINIDIRNTQGEALEGIEVIVSDNDTSYEYATTLYTDSMGVAVFETVDFPENPKKYYIKVKDIDENELFQSLDTNIVFEYEEFSKEDDGDRWYAGKAEKTLNLQLTKKKK